MKRMRLLLIQAMAWSSLAFCGEIHDATRSGELAKVKALLNTNSDLVFSKDDKGETPLLLAVKSDHKDVAALLLANRADVNTQGKDEVLGGPDGATGISLGGMPLDWAVQGNDIDMVELLLTNKANVNAKDGLGQTPLFWAVRAGKNMVQLLLGNGADVNAKANDGQTPLHIAAKEVAELLLANKAEVNVKDNDGMTPLHLAALHQAGDKVALLLANKAEVNAKDHDDQTPLHLAAEHCIGDITIAKLLVANGAAVNAKDKNGDTPSSIPKDYFCPRLTELLQRHGGQDPRPMDTNIIHAAENGDAQAVKTLLAKDPRLALNEDSNGNTPLDLAALYGLDR